MVGMTHESSTLIGYAIMTPIFGRLGVNDEKGLLVDIPKPTHANLFHLIGNY